MQHILEHYRGSVAKDIVADAPRLRRWLEAIEAHPAIKATQTHPEGDHKYPEELINHYSKYAGIIYMHNTYTHARSNLAAARERMLC